MTLSTAEQQLILTAANSLRLAALKARDQANQRKATIDHHGTDLVITTPESVLAERRAAIWDAAADDVMQLLIEPDDFWSPKDPTGQLARAPKVPGPLSGGEAVARENEAAL